MENLNDIKKGKKLRLKYNKKPLIIDVIKELGINESIINSQLKESPSSYAFLSMLKNKYIKERDKLERDKDIAYSEAYIYFRNSKTPGMTNEMANHRANTNKKYISYYNKWLIASKITNDLISLCKAYENREKLIQTLSANIRKEQ